MSPEAADLARALVAAPWWEWRAGTRTACGVRVTDGGRDYLIGYGWDGLIDTCATTAYAPDLDDPATAGVLQDVLSRLTTISVRTRPDPYGASVLYWLGDQPHATPLCPTLGVAVARALLAVRGGP